MLKYSFMHQNEIVAKLTIDERSNRISGFAPKIPELLPFMGTADISKMQFWLDNRVIPKNRSLLQDVLAKNNCKTAFEYLYKNLALSINDSYWLCPERSELTWNDVNLYDESLKITIGHEYSFSPNASLGGQMPKYIEGNRLCKTTKEYFGLQCFNEVIASRTHKRQHWTEHVNYNAKYDAYTGVASVWCELFTNKDIEFIPAYEVAGAKKKPNDRSGYDFIVDRCSALGIENAKEFIDYMTLTDFVLTNTDRHMYNFGILRNAATLKAIGMAPIFDTGNSMFFNDIRRLSRSQILNIRLNALSTREEQLLKHIENRYCVNVDECLSPEEIEEYLISMKVHSFLAADISQNYKVKLQMLDEFQHGHELSQYRELQKEREQGEER